MSDVTRRVSRWKAKFSPDIAAQTTARPSFHANQPDPRPARAPWPSRVDIRSTGGILWM